MPNSPRVENEDVAWAALALRALPWSWDIDTESDGLEQTRPGQEVAEVTFQPHKRIRKKRFLSVLTVVPQDRWRIARDSSRKSDGTHLKQADGCPQNKLHCTSWMHWRRDCGQATLAQLVRVCVACSEQGHWTQLIHASGVCCGPESGAVQT